MKANYLDKYKDIYKNENLGFDKILIYQGYLQYRKYFKGNTCLELGPANGIMTKYLKNDFEKLYIVEGSKQLLKQIPNYRNIIKIHSLFEDFKSKIKYDTIMMNHVLEHIKEPVKMLEGIRKLLKKNGIMILGVPNAKSFHRLAAVKMGLLKTEYQLNERDKQLGHFRVYDFNLLKKHVTNAGFKIIDEGGIFVKFLSNKQIENSLNKEIVQAYFELGNQFKNNSAEIFLILKCK